MLAPSTVERSRPDQELACQLPLDGWPEAVFEGSFTFDGGTLVVDGHPVLRAGSRADLERGVETILVPGGHRLAMRLVPEGQGVGVAVAVTVDGEAALRRDRLRARPTRSAWIHALLALGGSFAGFAASWLYLQRSELLHDAWALKMGNHMAGWHLLLTFSLFPASIRGGRTGIRVVQWVSGLFFAIHVGIAIANVGASDPVDALEGAIAFLNALSGALFLATVVYGNRAWRDMDPVLALREGRARRRRALTTACAAARWLATACA